MTAGERAVFAIDNVNIYTLVAIPNATNISYTKNSTTFNASKVIPFDASSISVTFDRIFDANTMTADNVKLMVNDVEVTSEVAYSEETNVLTITPAEGALTEYANAKIVLGEAVGIKTLIATQALNKEVAIDLKIGDTENCFYGVTFTKTETDVVGSYEIINESGAPKTMMIFMSLYKNNDARLVDVDYEAVTLESGKAIIKTLTKPISDAENTKALIWNENLDSILTIPAFALK